MSVVADSDVGTHADSNNRIYYGGALVCESVRTEANTAVIAAAPDLLALAHRYADECGECAGTRVCPDDEPCTECEFIWRVIDQAEGR